MNQFAPCVVLFQRDLRIVNHPALAQARKKGRPLIPLFIFDPAQLALGQAGAWWLRHALLELDHALQLNGSRLLVRRGDMAVVLLKLLRDSGADLVYLNRDVEGCGFLNEPDWLIRVKRTGVHVECCESPESTASFISQLDEQLDFERFSQLRLAALPRGLEEESGEPLRCGCASLSSDSIDDLPMVEMAGVQSLTLQDHWEPGELAVERLLRPFFAHRLISYPRLADQPAMLAGSRLSAYIRWGQIGLSQLYRLVPGPPQEVGFEIWRRGLLRREYAYYLSTRFPAVINQPMDPRFKGFPWRKDPMAYESWSQGETGVPFVDAAMRELHSNGWIHHQARVAAASFLSKNLLIDWRLGAELFLRLSVDGDPIVNAVNWQWVVGCAQEGEPFFRILNPVASGERYDPEGAYVRYWLPELKAMPKQWIHRPWEAPEDVLRQAGVVLGEHYPKPIADLKHSRGRALAAWSQLG